MLPLKRVLTIMCLLLISLCAAQAEQVDWEIANIERVTNPPESVALEYKFGDNEVRRYDVKLAGEGTMKLPGQAQEAKLQTNGDMVFTEQVLPQATASDTWRIRRTLAKGEITVPDFGTMTVAVPQLEVEVDKYGAVRTLKGLDGLSSTFGLPPDRSMADVLSQLKFVGFPRKAIKQGESWEDTYSIALAGQEAIPVKVTSTLSGFDRVQKTDCATVVSKYEAPFSFALDPIADKSAGDAKAAGKGRTLTGTEKGEFRTYFSYADGKIMQSYGTIELTADLDKAASTTAAAAASATAEAAKHDLNVKYYVTSIYNPVPYRQAAPARKGGVK